MQFISINQDTKYSDLTKIMKPSDIDATLAMNNIPRSPNVGQSLASMVNNIISSTPTVPWKTKADILNTMVDNSDVFETAALATEDTWKVLSKIKTFPNTMSIPETIKLPHSSVVMGNGEKVPPNVYKKVMGDLKSDDTNHEIDTSVFNDFNASSSNIVMNPNPNGGSNTAINWAVIPKGVIQIQSSISGEIRDIPAYPEMINDKAVASYGSMPDMLYTYEPWLFYQNSGPRQNSYSFKLHRDMWSGNHLDGRCNELIRFCQANCYPQFKGSSVITPTVTLYMAGKVHIHGVLNSVNVGWEPPIGQDGWYLMCTLELDITEVSLRELNYDTIQNKDIME